MLFYAVNAILLQNQKEIVDSVKTRRHRYGRKEECKEQDDIKNNIERTTMDTGCPYRKRCQHRTEECERKRPEWRKAEEEHWVACRKIKSFVNI